MFAHIGLAMATSLSSLLNATLLYWHWNKNNASILPGFGLFMLRIAIASIGLVIFLLMFNPALETWLAWSRITRIINLGALISISAVIYGATLLLLGIRFRQFGLKAG